MQLKKIRYVSGEGVELAWTTEVGDTQVESTLKSEDEPLPELPAALAALKPFLPKVLGIPAKVIGDDTTVMSVSVTQIPRTDRQGYNISAKRTIPGSNSPWNTNVPMIVDGGDDSTERAYFGDLFDAIHKVIDEGVRYLQGHRAQVELFATGNGRREKEPVADTPIEEQAARMERVRAAFVECLPKRPKVTDRLTDDDRMALFVAEAWEDRRTEFEGVPYDGIVRVGDVWCYLGSGPEPAFYFDVAAPDAFNPVDATPDVEGAQLVSWAREAYGIAAAVTA